MTRTPALHHEYLRLLSAHAPVQRIWAGPAYRSTSHVTATEAAIAINEANADLLRGGLEDWLPDVRHRQPFVARANVEFDAAFRYERDAGQRLVIQAVRTKVSADWRNLDDHIVRALAAWKTCRHGLWIDQTATVFGHGEAVLAQDVRRALRSAWRQLEPPGDSRGLDRASFGRTRIRRSHRSVARAGPRRHARAHSR